MQDLLEEMAEQFDELYRQAQELIDKLKEKEENNEQD